MFKVNGYTVEPKDHGYLIIPADGGGMVWRETLIEVHKYCNRRTA